MERKKGILVVEDDSICRKLVKVVLGQSDYDIAEVENGLDAVNQAYANRPDLIIMDLQLQDINGDEVIERLKADSSMRDIPVVVTTALEPESLSVKRAIAAGAATILYKPTPVEILEKVVRRYLSPR